MARVMTQADLPAVLAIEQAAQFSPWSETLFADCLEGKHYRCQVLMHGDEIVAFLVVSRILDETHILNIAVAPQWQRRGFASALLTQAINAAKQDAMTVIYLEVRQSNDAAQALYQQLGFRAYSTRKGYYRSPEGHEDAVLMQYVLAPGHK